MQGPVLQRPGRALCDEGWRGQAVCTGTAGRLNRIIKLASSVRKGAAVASVLVRIRPRPVRTRPSPEGKGSAGAGAWSSTAG